MTNPIGLLSSDLTTIIFSGTESFGDGSPVDLQGAGNVIIVGYTSIASNAFTPLDI